MRTGLKNLTDQSGGKAADRAHPADETFRRPPQVTLMRLRSMRIDSRVAADLINCAGMTGDTLAAVEDLDSHHGIAHVELSISMW